MSTESVSRGEAGGRGGVPQEAVALQISPPTGWWGDCKGRVACSLEGYALHLAWKATPYTFFPKTPFEKQGLNDNTRLRPLRGRRINGTGDALDIILEGI